MRATADRKTAAEPCSTFDIGMLSGWRRHWLLMFRNTSQ